MTTLIRPKRLVVLAATAAFLVALPFSPITGFNAPPATATSEIPAGAIFGAHYSADVTYIDVLDDEDNYISLQLPGLSSDPPLGAATKALIETRIVENGTDPTVYDDFTITCDGGEEPEHTEDATHINSDPVTE